MATNFYIQTIYASKKFHPIKSKNNNLVLENIIFLKTLQKKYVLSTHFFSLSAAAQTPTPKQPKLVQPTGSVPCNPLFANAGAYQRSNPFSCQFYTLFAHTN